MTDVRLRAVLRLILLAVNGDFYIRDGIIWITTTTRMKKGEPLRQRVDASFQKRPLNEALHELSCLTDVNVIMDSRVEKKAKLEISADLRGVPIEPRCAFWRTWPI